MYGRYGSDMLSLVLVSGGLIFWLLSGLIPVAVISGLFWLLSYAALIFAVFRMFSRNYAKRRSENDRFMELVTPFVQNIQRKRAQMRDKDHAYFRCPSCGQILRVPKGKNRISITCRNCGNVFQKKT